MTRAYCPTPDCCTAPKRGFCKCQVTSEMRQMLSAASKAMWADPERRQKKSAATTAMWADPEMRKKISAAMADPALRQRKSAAMKAVLAERDYVPVPPHLKTYAAKLRRSGITGDDLRKAIEVMS